MKIERLHIDNFGRLSNQDFSFGEGLNQLLNENGWGKTTLSIFIKAIFYGMPPARENVKMERKKYMPWQGGNFGGWLEFSCKKGRFRIVRSFAKTPEGDEAQLFDLTSNKVVQMPKEGLGEWLFGVGRETFEMTAFLPQLNFTSSVNEQISAGVLGLDKFKYDLASVGGALAQIKKEVSALKKDMVKQNDIDRISRHMVDLKADLAQAIESIKEVDRQIQVEQNNYAVLEEKVLKEKQTLQAHEKIFASKMKIESELKAENEKLSALLIKLNSISPERKEMDKKSFPWLIVVASIVLLAGVALGLARVVSWVVAGSVCGVGAFLGVLSFVFRKKYKQASQKQTDKAQTYELDKKITQCQEDIEKLKNLLANYSEISLPNSTLADYQQNLLFNSKLSLERLSTQKKTLMYQQDRLQQEIESMKEELANKKAINKKTGDKLEVLQYTHDFLVKAKENVSERFVKPINDGMRVLLEKFDMRGREYIVDTNFDIKQITNGGVKDFEHSSQGYKDILSICMRFLLIKEVYKEEKPCVILDDSFVNFDDENFQKAKQVLQQLSQDLQILYICCSQSREI